MFYKACALFVTLCVILATLLFSVHVLYPIATEDLYLEDSYFADCWEPNSIAIFPLYGDIAWGVSDSGASVYGYEVEMMFREMAEVGGISGIVIDIDSPGGYPVAAYRLAELVRELEIPTAAAVGDMALSGGYAVAAAADRIFIHPASDVGSIGVTASYVDESMANEASGYIYESLSTGDFKDVGDPARGMSEEERMFMMENLQKVHEYFVGQVATDRGLTFEEAAALADGKWYSNTQAIELGLADEFGGVDEAIAYVRSQTGANNPVCYLPVM